VRLRRARSLCGSLCGLGSVFDPINELTAFAAAPIVHDQLLGGLQRHEGAVRLRRALDAHSIDVEDDVSRHQIDSLPEFWWRQAQDAKTFEPAVLQTRVDLQALQEAPKPLVHHQRYLVAVEHCWFSWGGWGAQQPRLLRWGDRHIHVGKVRCLRLAAQGAHHREHARKPQTSHVREYGRDRQIGPTSPERAWLPGRLKRWIFRRLAG